MWSWTENPASRCLSLPIPSRADIPTKTTAKVIYFGPGVTDLGQEPLKIPDGQTVYLAGGAYVKGRLQAAETTGNQGVTVRGRGILSGIGIAGNRGSFRQFMIGATTKAPDLHVEGIVITDGPGVGLLAYRRLVAENVKLLAWIPQTDGISGGKNSRVQNCFLKVDDDALHFHKSGTTLIDNVVWKQNFGSVLQMGWNETQSVDGELCDGLDIIGDDRGKLSYKREYSNSNVVALIDIHNRAAYKDVVIQNVRHEKKSFQLFGVRTMLAMEDKHHAKYRDGRGSVDGMVLRNIAAAEEPVNPSVFDGNGSEPGQHCQRHVRKSADCRDPGDGRERRRPCGAARKNLRLPFHHVQALSGGVDWLEGDNGFDIITSVLINYLPTPSKSLQDAAGRRYIEADCELPVSPEIVAPPLSTLSTLATFNPSLAPCFPLLTAST